MKNIVILLIVLFSSNLSFFGQSKNEVILKFVDAQMNKKVDRGECWDLVAFALDASKAEWNAPYDFGNEIDSEIKPGDIISFKNVKFKSENGYMTFPEHYAIVYAVKDNDHIVIAHQNHNNKKVVQLLDLTLSDQSKGKITFFRAQ